MSIEDKNEMEKAKPFLKWAGGKTQLLDRISTTFPYGMNNIKTYVEPFIGCGAVAFWVLSNYPEIKVVINDFNSDLINVYRAVRSRFAELVSKLQELDNAYKALENDELQKNFYLQIRKRYNERSYSYTTISPTIAALFIFLNRTCFNGLYRVNSKNGFNVPWGKYKNPTICDYSNLSKVSKLLGKVEILNGDYSKTLKYANESSLFYFDPPYKPISQTSSFNSYSFEAFDDNQQVRLKEFCDAITKNGAKFVLSNSDPTGVDSENTFFDELFKGYTIHRVEAKRNINSKGNARGAINELLINNFSNV